MFDRRVVSDQTDMAASDSPRDVYLAACEQVGAALAGDGFQYARSGQHATRKRDNWTDRVVFQSSHSNVAGSVVKLWVAATVSNSALGSWRTRTDSPFAGSRVAGGHLGNLAAGTWREWNVADPVKREEAIVEILRAVRDIALPYFALVSDPPALLARLSSDEVPLLDLKDAVELLLFALGPEAAQQYFSVWCKRHGELMPSINEHVAILASGSKIVKHSEAFAAQAANLMKHHGLRVQA